MRWEIDGQVLEVQGCIERALDIITSENVKYNLVETAASKEYMFTHSDVGNIGKVKISILPGNQTELYGYPPDLPDDEWLVQYLPSHCVLTAFSQPLQLLLKTYAWQIEQNIFQLNATELFRLAHSEEAVDYGWERYGLANLELRKQAMAEFQGWRAKIHKRKVSEFQDMLDAIESQIRMDGLQIKKLTREGKNETSSERASHPTDYVPAQVGENNTKPGQEVSLVKDTRIPKRKYDDLCRLWVNRPYIPRQSKDEFLAENASELDKKTFDRILKDAYQREIIDKDPGPRRRYKPKTVP